MCVTISSQFPRSHLNRCRFRYTAYLLRRLTAISQWELVTLQSVKCGLGPRESSTNIHTHHVVADALARENKIIIPFFW